MLEAIQTLIRRSDVCVLATVSGGTPHCSLMSYVADDACREFYMMTLKGSKKYRNLQGNRSLSLLIDSREEEVGRRRDHIRALTVGGVYRTLEDPAEEARILRQLLQRHPHLRELAESGHAEVFAVRARSFQLLDGLNLSHYEEVD